MTPATGTSYAPITVPSSSATPPPPTLATARPESPQQTSQSGRTTPQRRERKYPMTVLEKQIMSSKHALSNMVGSGMTFWSVETSERLGLGLSAGMDSGQMPRGQDLVTPGSQRGCVSTAVDAIQDGNRGFAGTGQVDVLSTPDLLDHLETFPPQSHRPRRPAQPKAESSCDSGFNDSFSPVMESDTPARAESDVNDNVRPVVTSGPSLSHNTSDPPAVVSTTPAITSGPAPIYVPSIRPSSSLPDQQNDGCNDDPSYHPSRSPSLSAVINPSDRPDPQPQRSISAALTSTSAKTKAEFAKKNERRTIVAWEIAEDPSYCHQCRNNTYLEKMKCTTISDEGLVCGLRYCHRCIDTRSVYELVYSLFRKDYEDACSHCAPSDRAAFSCCSYVNPC